jgi:hypothetical protein
MVRQNFNFRFSWSDISDDQPYDIFHDNPYQSISDRYRRQQNPNFFNDEIDDEENFEGHWNLI